MPSISALVKIALYWLFWLLIARRLLQGHQAGETLSTLAWLIGTGAVAAWFTWIKLYDDKQARLYGKDSNAEGGPASPASRFVGAVTLAIGAFACLSFGALLPEFRSALVSLGLIALVAAGFVLFFGRRSSNYDIDL